MATGVPLGLGSHVHWDRRLDGALARRSSRINIVKGVEFGLGFEQTRRRRLGRSTTSSTGRRGRPVASTARNNAGGLTGGITNGEPLVVRGAVKPISTLARPLPSADLLTGQPVDVAHYERSDISVVPAAGVIGEAMVLLTLARFLLEKTGGDSLAEVRDNLARYQARAAAATGERSRRRTRGRLGRRRLRAAAMELVLVGLPGSGKSAVGRRIAHARHAEFIDLDAAIEARAGAPSGGHLRT